MYTFQIYNYNTCVSLRGVLIVLFHLRTDILLSFQPFQLSLTNRYSCCCIIVLQEFFGS